MGWVYTRGGSRKDQIRNLTMEWENTDAEGTMLKSCCLARCYRGGAFSGVLWTVWERTFERGGETVQPTERWIMCYVLQYRADCGWGYKDISESMHPYYFSCPLKYLAMVPIEQYGGNREWREFVERYHAQAKDRRRAGRAA